MKRYIDLFKQQAKQKKSTIYLQQARKIGMYLFGVLLVVLVFEWGAFWFLNVKLSEKEQLKNRYNTYIQQNQSLDKKISTFLFKYQLLQQYVKDDANIYFYYDLLGTLVHNANEKAIMSAFSIDKTQLVKFSVTFDTYDQAIAFMSQMESDTFVEYFEELELQEFNISSDQASKYILEFSGKFTKVTDASQI